MRVHRGWGRRRRGETKEAEEAPQKADVPGIDEARGAPPLPRSPYLGRSTPNAADTAYGWGKRVEGWERNRQPVGCRGGFGKGGGLIWGQPREYPSSFCELIARPSASTASSFIPSPLQTPPSPYIHDIVCSGSLDLSINLLSSLCAAPRIPTSDPWFVLIPPPTRRMLPSSGGSPTEDVSCEPCV